MTQLFTIVLAFILLIGPAVSAESEPPQIFSRCANCHTTAAEGQHRNAPPLAGIVGREIAAMPDFKYSEALKAEEGIWTRAKLDAFLQRPNHVMADTKMYFRGIVDAEDRTRLIEWLATADVPSVIPPRSKRRPPEPVTPAKKSASDLFRACKGCHNYAKDAPAKVGPNLWGVVGRPVASFPGFNYSERLRKRGGVWDVERLHIFFTEKKTFGQGVHLPFRMLKEKEDRDTLINFLKSLSHEG